MKLSGVDKQLLWVCLCLLDKSIWGGKNGDQKYVVNTTKEGINLHSDNGKYWKIVMSDVGVEESGS